MKLNFPEYAGRLDFDNRKTIVNESMDKQGEMFEGQIIKKTD